MGMYAFWVTLGSSFPLGGIASKLLKCGSRDKDDTDKDVEDQISLSKEEESELPPETWLQIGIGLGITFVVALILYTPHFDDCSHNRHYCSQFWDEKTTKYSDKRETICWNPWGFGWLRWTPPEGRQLRRCCHLDKHFLDPFSALHILIGMVLFYGYKALHERGSHIPMPLVVLFAIAGGFEIFENSKPFRKCYSPLGGDTVANSVGDILVAWLGWEIARHWKHQEAFYWILSSTFLAYIFTTLTPIPDWWYLVPQ